MVVVRYVESIRLEIILKSNQAIFAAPRYLPIVWRVNGITGNVPFLLSKRKIILQPSRYYHRCQGGFYLQNAKDSNGNGGDDTNTVDIRLTIGNKALPAEDLSLQDGLSTLTGETRESKAKAYATKESMNFSSQYISSIDIMKSEHDKQIADLMKKLKAAELKKIHQFRIPQHQSLSM